MDVTIGVSAVVEFCTDLPEEIAGWVSDAARRLDVTRSEIVQRAVEHYLGHFDEVRVAFEQRQQQRGARGWTGNRPGRPSKRPTVPMTIARMRAIARPTCAPCKSLIAIER